MKRRELIITVLVAMALSVLFLAAHSRKSPDEQAAPLPPAAAPTPADRPSLPVPSTRSVVVQSPAPQSETNRPRPSYSLRSDDDEPGSDVLSWDRMKTNPQYAVRVDRHMAVKHLLSSDAARSPQGRQIIALCRAFGYEPWTVSGAYTIAWEYSKVRPEGFYPPDRPNFELLSADGVAAMIQYNLGFQFAPEFLEQIKLIKPLREFGRDYGIGVTAEPLLDETTWANIPPEIAINP